MLTTCIDEIIELQEKMYVYDAGSEEYTEVWKTIDHPKLTDLKA
jgi:hypothetical protein